MLVTLLSCLCFLFVVVGALATHYRMTKDDRVFDVRDIKYPLSDASAPVRGRLPVVSA